MKRNKIKKGLLIAVGIFGLFTISKADLKKGLTYYEPMDGSLKPVYYEGSEKTFGNKSCSFSEGKVGQAVVLKSKTAGALCHAGNLNYPEGSLAFWYKPEYNPRAPKKSRSLFRCGNITLTWVPKNAKLFFMTAIVKPPKGFIWDYSTWTNAPYFWKQGEWHHIVLTWNAVTKKKQIFIDGKLVSEKITNNIDKVTPVRNPIKIGGNNADGAYDEFMVWNRKLGEDEVKQLYKSPEKVAEGLRTKKNAPSVAKCPLQVNLKPLKNPVESILLPGAVFESSFELENTSNKLFKKSVILKLEDIRGKVFAAKSLSIEIAPGSKKVFSTAFKLPLLKGSFKVGMHFDKFAKDVAICAAWPKPSGQVDKDSFFANHVNGFGGEFLKQAARLGLGWQRVHDMLQFTWWNRVQPEPGEFKWKLDAIWEKTKKYNMPVLGCLTGSPYWATRSGPETTKGGARGFASMPKMDFWRKYVKETVKHYKNDIKYWEIYNEPAVPGFWRGTPAELAQLTIAACEEVRKEDPEAKVMASGFTYCSWRYHEECAKAGLFKPLDIISFHYCPKMEEPEISSKKYADVVNHFKRLWRQYGPQNKPVRLWSTESSINSTTWFRGLNAPELPEVKFRTPMDNLKACKRIIQGVVIMQSMGVEKHFYYWFGPLRLGKRSAVNSSMIDVTYAPRPKQMARVAMAEQIDGTVFTKLIKRKPGRLWAAVYQNKNNPNKSVVIWWCGTNGKISLDLNWKRKAQAIDMMGNSIKLDSSPVITDEPSFIRLDDSAKSVIKALKKATIKVLTTPGKITKIDTSNKPDVPALPDYVAPTENISSIFFVNLKPYCNMSFADDKAGNGKGGWADEGPMNDMRDMPVGRKTYYGVPFEIIDPAKNNSKSIISLRGKAVTPKLPLKVNIPVNRKNVRCLYFLQSASYGKRGLIGKYVINYTDGTNVSIKNAIPVNNGNWWNGYYKDEKELSRPVPIKVTSTLSGKPAWRYLRIFEWNNPSRSKTIKSIEAVSTNNIATPILIAITGCE